MSIGNNLSINSMRHTSHSEHIDCSICLQQAPSQEQMFVGSTRPHEQLELGALRLNLHPNHDAVNGNQQARITGLAITLAPGVGLRASASTAANKDDVAANDDDIVENDVVAEVQSMLETLWAQLSTKAAIAELNWHTGFSEHATAQSAAFASALDAAAELLGAAVSTTECCCSCFCFYHWHYLLHYY